MAKIKGISAKLIDQYVVRGEEDYASVKHLGIIENIDTYLSTFPEPASLLPSFIMGSGAKALKEVSLHDVAGTGLEYILNEICQEKDKEPMMRSLMLNHLIFWDFSKGTAKERDYEKIKKIGHPLTVLSMLPENAPSWVKLAAMNHDLVEDSKRHDVLKKWYEGKNLLPEELDLLNLGEIPQPLDKRHRTPIYRQRLENLINLGVNLINPGEEIAGRIYESLRFLTHPEYLTYKQYIQRLVNVKDLDLSYWLMIIKMNDRIDNSHFNFHIHKGDTEELKTNGPKVLKDAIKNIYLLEASKLTYLRLKRSGLFTGSGFSEAEYLKRHYELADLTNRNMNQFISTILDMYGELPIEWRKNGKIKKYSISSLFVETVSNLYGYYLSGGFSKKDDSVAKPEELFNFKGSVSLLDSFIEKRIDLFGRFDDSYKVALILKYASLVKVFSGLYLSRSPFTDSKIDIHTLGEPGAVVSRNIKMETRNLPGDIRQLSFGRYLSELNDYSLKNFMDAGAE